MKTVNLATWHLAVDLQPPDCENTCVVPNAVLGCDSLIGLRRALSPLLTVLAASTHPCHTATGRPGPWASFLAIVVPSLSTPVLLPRS